MRTKISLCVFIMSFFVAFGQNELPQPIPFTKVSVTKSVTGIQVGFFGTEFYNESKLNTYFALRSEFALNFAFWAGYSYEKEGYALVPSLNIYPKYYYNIVKRGEKKSKNIANNGANYFSLQIKYFPNWFVISNYDNLGVSNQVSFIPTFGIRRNFARKFNYEFKIGYGLGYVFENKNWERVFDLGFKIGYDF